jgi:hypothetical protein
MSNLNSIVPTSPVTQKGGRGHNHKMGCKCPLCKRGGRGHNHKMGCKCPLCKRGGVDPSNDDDYGDDDLDQMEKGESTGKGPGEFKAGGSRRRRHRRTKKGGRKSTHKKRRVGRKGRKTRRHRR